MSGHDGTPRHAPASVTVPFGLAACCAAGFAVSYVLDLGTPALGATLGGALALVALGLARWARLIDREEPMYVEEREVGPAPPPAYQAFRSALTEQPVPRSGVLWGALGVALASIGGAMLFPLRSLLPASRRRRKSPPNSRRCSAASPIATCPRVRANGSTACG